MSRNAPYIVNAITLYRIATAPLLLLLLWQHELSWFKWLLAVSFLTDAIDGIIARRYKVTSIVGARLDSIGDDLTVLVAIIGMLVLKWEFVVQVKLILLTLSGLFVIQTILSLVRYGKQSSFHTLLAKAAAVLQAMFLLLLFLLSSPPHLLFYLMAAITAMDLAEEIILVMLLPRWQANVKGIYWIWRDKVHES
jgi:CDP-diacylglycerol--glycerol-3-phosphate 3-phosphatidyltransferase